MAKVDWIAIKNEYINTNISYKALADRYPVSKTAIANKAKKEHWVELREQNLTDTCAKVVQETREKIVDMEVDRIAKLLDITDEMQEKISVCLGQLNSYVDMFGKVYRCEILDVNRLKKLVSALKDVKDIIKVDGTDDIDKLDAVLKKIEGNI